jgi:hypothetical protein
MDNDSTTLDSFKVDESPTVKAKPTFKVRRNPNANLDPYLLLLKKFEEQNNKIDLIEKATLHLISMVSKVLEEKRYDKIRERERRWS